MTREQIVELCKEGREISERPSFAQTPVNPKHIKRLSELKSEYVAPDKDPA